jgi:uncharacterized protein YndB with AHSA1/START domain
MIVKYSIECSATFAGDVQSVWNAWTDMASYPDWDPREEELRLDAPFAVGATGFSKQVGPRAGSTFQITRVEPMDRWTNECPLPGGRLVLDHTIQSVGQGQVLVVKTYEAHGPMSVLFRLFLGKGIRSEAPSTFAALAAEARSRVAQ